MGKKAKLSPQSFAVVGAGPVGCIVAAFLAKGGQEVTLCDVIPGLVKPALDPGIIIEGAENLQVKVTHTCTAIDELANNGVKLTIDGSPVLSDLKDLEVQEIHILVCGTCLTHFNLLDKKQVGETTNMLDIITAMQLADKVINL